MQHVSEFLEGVGWDIETGDYRGDALGLQLAKHEFDTLQDLLKELQDVVTPDLAGRIQEFLV